MNSDWRLPHHRKRKRRRAEDRLALPAELFLDPKVHGDIALVSEDLFYDLFPFSSGDDSRKDKSGTHKEQARPCYIAIQCRTPGSQARPDSGQWTIVQVQVSSIVSSTKPTSQSSIRVSKSSGALHHLYAAQSHEYSSLLAASGHRPVDIYVLDVLPIQLETVVIHIDGIESSKDDRPENAPLQFKIMQKNDHTQVIRNALGAAKIIRSGDALEISFDTKTKALAVVEFSSPVSQGILCDWTKVVVAPVPQRNRSLTIIHHSRHSNSGMQGRENTSKKQFHSATEEAAASPRPLDGIGLAPRTQRAFEYQRRGSVSEESVVAADTDLSDSDSETVGLTLPSLPSQAVELLSELSSASPYRCSSVANGTTSPTPAGSDLFDSTIRAGVDRAKVFSTQELSLRVPEECLQPQPLPYEDEEARIFTDAAALSKLGCFSGDWVTLEPIIPALLDENNSFESGLSGVATNRSSNGRPVKIYALPNNLSQKSGYAINNLNHQFSKNSNKHFDRPSLVVFMPPMLLFNTGHPSFVRICGLANQMSRDASTARLTSESLPPVAKEARIFKLATPLATEKYLNTSLFQGLRRYFAMKRRIVKGGDLIGFSLDDDLARATYQGSPSNEDVEQDDLLMKDNQFADNTKAETAKVAWFKIESHAIDSARDTNEVDSIKIWSGAVTIVSGTTRLAQAGSENGKVPATLSSKWPFYFGAKQLPAQQSSDLAIGSSAGIPQSYISTTRRRLRELISVATSPQAIHFKMPPAAVLLTSTQKHIGKATSALNACADLGLHTFTIDIFDILSEGGPGGGDDHTVALLESRAERAMTCGADFTALLIKHIDALTADRMVQSLQNILKLCRVLLATTTDIDKVHESIRGLFVHELQLTAPDEKEREGLLQDIVRSAGIAVAHDVDMSTVALKTAALVAGDLVDVVDRALVARDERLEKLAMTSSKLHACSHERISIRDLQLAGGYASRCVMKADFDVAVDAARKNFADAIGAPKIPNVTWDDVGGLSNVKDAVMETIQLPLERPELFTKGMKKRSGILFYGPPGTGKTLLAKAIATEFSLNFFSVKGPEMLNMYIGESEANVRRVFQRARDARPCVVFFDELDSVAPRRGKSGDSQGVMDRIVSQLLAELDGMSDGEGSGVFVIGATNRPDLLDQALLRPGRFDKMLYLGVSDTHEKQLTILEALTRKFTLHRDLALSKVASSLSFTYTGADLYALCSDAMLKAITRRATSVDNQIRAINIKRAASTPSIAPITVAYFFDHLAKPTDTEVVVGFEDFQSAIRELVPSVSVKELEHYNRVREEFEKGDEKKEELGARSDILVRGKKSSENRTAWSNGNAHGQQIVNGEDYILRTSGLSLDDSLDTSDHINGWNGYGKGKGKGKENGKGKGKLVELADPASNGFGDATNGDEDMYNI